MSTKLGIRVRTQPTGVPFPHCLSVLPTTAVSLPGQGASMSLGLLGESLGIEHWASASADLGFTWELMELPMLGALASLARALLWAADFENGSHC